MIRAVADTHALVWALFDDARLSPAARSIFQAAGDNQVAMSSISLAEVLYLEERHRVPKGTLERIKDTLIATPQLLVEVPVNLDVIEAMSRVSRDEIPDFPDRLIAATALMLDVPLVTRDGKIRASRIVTIW